MSEIELQALHDQLRKLRGQLPEFLQALTSLDDAKSSKDAFFTVARALSSWTTETQSFVSSYEMLKPAMEELRKGSSSGPAVEEPLVDGPSEPTKAEEEQPSYEFSNLDGFGNDFFDLS